MKRLFRRLLESIGFLSIIPIGRYDDITEDELARSAAYFPAVGLLIGLGGAALATGLDKIMAVQATNALLILYLVVITGGLHLDALADTVDGLLGGKTPEARLAIMREGASGPLGVTAVTLALLLKFTLLSSLTVTPRLLALAVVPALARWPMVYIAHRLPAVRSSGLGYIFATGVRASDVATAAFLSAAATVSAAAFFGWTALALAPLVGAIAFAGVKLTHDWLGGVTGDTLGATVELSEVLLFLAIGVLSRYA